MQKRWPHYDESGKVNRHASGEKCVCTVYETVVLPLDDSPNRGRDGSRTHINACNFHSIAWRKVSITRVERSDFLSVSMTDAFTIWLLLRLVEEAGFEPACLLVTPGRLRNAKSESRRFQGLKILREWIEVAAFAARQSFLMLVTSIRLRIRKTPPREW